MKLTDAISLLKPAHLEQPHPQHWADLGSGELLFTHALGSLLAPGSRIFAVDNIAMPPEKGPVEIVPLKADFVLDELPLEGLDGILMANALHYVADPAALLRKTAPFFRQRPLFVVVEYDTEVPVPVWVPHPVSFSRLGKLAEQLGYADVARLGNYDSRYGGVMYAAVVRG